MDLIQVGLECGADLAGVAEAAELLDKGAIASDLLPSVKTVIVVACPHSRTALSSPNLQVKQYDTISAYESVRAVCARIVRKLENRGIDALAVPAFIPIDMSDGKYGMVGAVDHRAAGVAAGIGCYGSSGLLLTEKYGPKIRLGSVLVSLEVRSKGMTAPDLCPEACTICLDGCPADALQGDGRIDKDRCARRIFDYGLRRVIKFAAEMIQASPVNREQLLKSFTFRELWQNFMTGNYYYCFECQNLCPVGKRGTNKATSVN